MRKFRDIDYVCNFCGAYVDCSYYIENGTLTVYIRPHECEAERRAHWKLHPMKPLTRDRLILLLWTISLLLSALFGPSWLTNVLVVIGILLFFWEIFRKHPKEALKRIEELEAELKVSDELLKDRDALLEAIPECHAHGKCMPHALEWIKQARSVLPDVDKYPVKIPRHKHTNYPHGNGSV